MCIPRTGDNFGVQDVLVDPDRPSDLYAFACYNALHKSTDYGLTWTPISAPGSVFEKSKPWGEGIGSAASGAPPTLYSLVSNNTGLWKSTDGGVNWVQKELPADGKPRPQDGYNVDVDPYDAQHLVVGFHEQTGIVESVDGGETFRSVTLAPGMSAGVSWYVFFIDTQDAVTTGQTWLATAQIAGGNAGTWRTSDAGSTWSQVETLEHPHGGSQLYQTESSLYMAGIYGSQGWGAYKSEDLGITWSHVGSATAQSNVYGTPNAIYTQNGQGTQGSGVDQSQAQRALLPGATFETWSDLPMSTGPKRAAVTYDGTHYIVVSGNWNAGIWRYVEPLAGE
jgi:hypothetical protein